ncbi:Epoxyqueuosine reductase [subsurface metagenome]
MKKLTIDQWERKYVVGEVQRFDQKNTMFTRPSWEPELKRRLKDWSFLGEVTDKPGSSLPDFALRRGARVGTQAMLFNMSKPNPSRLTIAFSQAMREATKTAALPGGTVGQDAATLKPPEWAKSAYAANPQTATRDVKKAALYFGADLVGVCRLDRRWVYSHTYHGEGPGGGTGDSPVVIGESKPQEIPEEFQYAVVMAFAEDYNMLKYYPSWIAHAATSMGYSMMTITTMYLSAFIRNLGFKAIDCTVNDVALSIPMAMQAGLGQLGRNGLLITPQFGPRVRISKVITDLPLVADSPIDFGVTEFCEACKKCAHLCPSQSIMNGERTTEPNNISNVSGELKWPLNAETCRMYWGRMNCPCTSCQAVCPYNKPDTLFHRIARWFTDHARWADSLYVKMDDLFGYGKPHKPDKFWAEWQPK